MTRTQIEGGRFHNNEVMLYFGIALLLGGLAGKAADSVPILDTVKSLVSTVADTEDSGTEVGPHLSK